MKPQLAPDLCPTVLSCRFWTCFAVCLSIHLNILFSLENGDWCALKGPDVQTNSTLCTGRQVADLCKLWLPLLRIHLLTLIPFSKPGLGSANTFVCLCDASVVLEPRAS